jgi:hypothetical protein
MLKHSLELTDNVTVLIDRYDEISPMHVDKANVEEYHLLGYDAV